MLPFLLSLKIWRLVLLIVWFWSRTIFVLVYLNFRVCKCAYLWVCVCARAHFRALSKIHRLPARFCYSGLPAVLDQGGTCSRNRSVDLGHRPSCCVYQLCWQFDGNFNLAVFPCWCLCYIEDNIWWKQSFFENLPSSPRILLFDNILLFSFFL